MSKNPLLYQEDMFLKEFEAEVRSVKDDKYVVLNRTAFYPKGGGVDYDTGKLVRKSDGKEFNVVYVGKFGGNVSHEVDTPGLEAGDKVKGEIDWERRHNLSRYHTATHVLSAVFYNEADVKVTGNKLEADRGRVDFNFPEFSREKMEKLVEQSNEVIEKDLPIEVYYMPRSELKEHPDLVKLDMGLPKKIKKVRIVDIKGFDRQPDGGCHVKSTAEIGKIQIHKMANKGKNTRRLYFTLKK